MDSRKFVLVRTDGYHIYHQVFSNKDEAIYQMSSEYKDLNKNPPNSNEAEMSYINENQALLYDRDIDVYVWKIIEV